MKIRDAANALRPVARIRVRDASNVLRTVSRIRVRDASNVLRDMVGIGGLTVTANPGSVYGYGNSHSFIAITTTYASVTVAGGTPPYSYAWESVDGFVTPVAGTSESTQFRGVGVGPGDSQTDQAFCTVTDANGVTGVSNLIFTYVENYGT